MDTVIVMAGLMGLILGMSEDGTYRRNGNGMEDGIER